MDWSKAKTILIVAFIITNVFLLYNIRNDIMEENYFAKKDEEWISDIVKILEENNIIINTEIPRDTETLSDLTVEYQTFNPKKIADKILGNYEILGEEYIKGGETVKTLNNDRLLIYENKSIDGTGQIAKEEAEEVAKAFLKEFDFWEPKSELQAIKISNEGNINVIYSQVHDGKFLGDSYMKLVISNGQVSYFEKKWMIPRTEKGQRKKVIPATTALLMAIDDIKEIAGESKDAVITEIRLGYLLDISSYDTLIKWYEIESGDASPYWRIKVADDGKGDEDNYIYIEAFD